jgi:hypothetical protein
MKKIKLFSLKGGLELMDHDFMVTMSDHIYLFFSMGKFFHFIFYFLGEDFDHSVRMEFLEIK